MNDTIEESSVRSSKTKLKNIRHLLVSRLEAGDINGAKELISLLDGALHELEESIESNRL